MSIRPTTGRLLQMRAVRPMRGVCISTVAVSTATISQVPTMFGAFEVDGELVI